MSNIILSQNNFSIEQRINKINDFINVYEFKPMINLNDNNFTDTIDCNNVNYKDLIDNLGNNIIYIKSGSTGHTFKGSYIVNDVEYNFAIKIVVYQKKNIYGNEYSCTRPENAEKYILKCLSYFVINNCTPHIILPITTFYTDFNYINKLFKSCDINNDKYKKFMSEYKKSGHYDYISILISEWANGGDLLDYLRKNYNIIKVKQWRVLFFQILSVLAVIQSKYPNFRHNDLKANNILIYNINNNDQNKFFIYNINNQKYIVPNIGLQIKIWDFDFACIGDVIENDKVNSSWANNINISSEKNQYYDLHYFFNSLTRKNFIPDLFENKNISPIIKKFIKSIVPDKYHSNTNNISENGRLLVNDEFTTPDIILKNNEFFKKMRL